MAGKSNGELGLKVGMPRKRRKRGTGNKGHFSTQVKIESDDAQDKHIPWRYLRALRQEWQVQDTIQRRQRGNKKWVVF